MPPKSLTTKEWAPEEMLKLAVIAGLIGFIFQILPGLEFSTFLMGIGVLAGLAASSQSFDERESELLLKSYAQAFQWLFTAVFFLYALVLALDWFSLGLNFHSYLGSHWLGLTISGMCTLLGLAGLSVFREGE